MKLMILGTGSMADTHALAFAAEKGVKVVAAVEHERRKAGMNSPRNRQGTSPTSTRRSPGASSTPRPM